MNADIFALLLKVSAILAAAAIAVLALRRSSAARRHFVWFAAMSSVLVMVLLQLIVPPIVVPVAQHSPLAAFAQATPDKFAASAGGAPYVAHIAASAGIETAPDALIASSVPAELSNVALSSGELLNVARTNVVSMNTAPANVVPAVAASLNAALTSISPSNVALTNVSSSNASPSNVVSSHVVPSLQLRSILLSAWLAGSLLLLLRLLLGHWQIGRIVRSAQTIDGSAQYPDVERIRTQLGVLKPIRLLVHGAITTPCTAGYRNPIILLPVAFATWDATRQRAVFTHELAHVARNDSLAQTVASLACALFWFHPGFWMAARMLRGESERAADDCVINSGMAPIDYADHLIAIAALSSSQLHVPSIALGMARASQLELRLRAMLNARQSRSVITRGVKRVIGAAALMVVIPCAGLQARVQVPQPARPKPPVVAPVAPTKLQLPQTAARLILPTVPPNSSHNGIELPVAPPPTRVAAPALPSRDVAAPPLPSSDVAAPPLPSTRVAAPPLPARDVVVPPLPTTPSAAPAAPTRMKPPEPLARADTTFERTIDAKPGDSLLVNIPAGGNVTVNGWDSNSAKLKATIGGRYWRETRVFFRSSNNRIQLFSAPEVDGVTFVEGITGSNSPNIVLRSPTNAAPYKAYIPTTADNEFELWVPRKTHVKFTSPIGSITLRNIDGDIDGSTNFGTLDIANAAGKANLVTENGDVRIASSALTGSVHTGCGALNVSNSGTGLAATTAFDPSPPKDPRYANIRIIIDGRVSTDYCRLKPRIGAEPKVSKQTPSNSLAIDSAAPDSIFDRTIMVYTTDPVILNIESSGELVLHASNDNIVRVRAVVPREVVAGNDISLKSQSRVTELRVSTNAASKAGAKRARYDVWIPVNTPVFVQPTNSDIVTNLTVAGPKELPGIKTIHIDGSLNTSCATVVVAQIVGQLHGKLSCGAYVLPTPPSRPVRVLVNGKLRSDIVVVLNPPRP